MNSVNISKKLSWILRHGAIKSGIQISSDGYVYIEDLLKHKSFKNVSFEKIKEIVERNDKKRYMLETEEDGRVKIKACQGHSMEIPELDLELIENSEDVACILHGTSKKAWESIQKEGLSRMNRQHIHFCTGVPGSEQVISGYRNSSKVIIQIDAEKAIKDGLMFYRSENNVVLSAGDFNGHILPKYFKNVELLP